MKNNKKFLMILITTLFLFTGCSSVNETLSTGYDSLLDGVDVIKKNVSSGYNKTKSVIKGE
jgi:uncharacterized protein YcfL